MWFDDGICVSISCRANHLTCFHCHIYFYTQRWFEASISPQRRTPVDEYDCLAVPSLVLHDAQGIGYGEESRRNVQSGILRVATEAATVAGVSGGD